MLKKTTAFLLLSAIFAGVLTGCSKEDNNKNQSDSQIREDTTISVQSNVIFTIGEKTYYNSGTALFRFNDENSLKPAMVQQDDGAPEAFEFSPSGNLLIEDKLYGTYHNSESFVCWDLSNDTDIGCTTLMDKEGVGSLLLNALEAENSPVTYKERTMLETALVCAVNYPADGGDGYLYFPLLYDREYYPGHKVLQFRVVGIAEDGSKIKLQPEIHAASLTVRDGYMYFYDNGFNVEKETFDKDVCGIYKMKTDGSEKEKLTGCNPAENDLLWYRPSLNLCGNELYYIDRNDKGESYLTKLSLDNNHTEQVSNEQCTAYCLDPAENMLYYLWEDASGESTLYSRSMSDNKENKLISTKGVTAGNPLSMGIYGNYLYLSTDSVGSLWTYVKAFDTNDEDNIPVGFRFDKKTGAEEELYCLRTEGNQTKSMIYWKAPGASGSIAEGSAESES